VTKKRILSGMRPTGLLHLGNLHGALKNWVDLQNEGTYDCYYFVADWHALTSDYNHTDQIKEHTLNMVIDWLSVGLDPLKSTFFIQSSIKEHAELFVILSMITPLPWLERNPTYKEVKEELAEKDLSTFGFLGYPVLQAADIIMYKAYGVPVGVDQLPHIELTREIARRYHAHGRCR
jgi:tryptophanyl-tRNA synthetase